MTQEQLDLIQIITNLITAAIAALVAWRIFLGQRNDAKRQFCFELQRQFDSPEMFKCRYEAWRLLNSSAFIGVTTTDQLVAHANYTVQLSTVLHFFETLDHFADQGLIDVKLAGKMFNRTYQLWYEKLIKDLAPSADQNLQIWMASIKGLNARWS